jgi:hypothetical protein
MGQIESTLGDHFYLIPEADLVAYVAKYAQDDYSRSKCRPANNSSKLLSVLTTPPRLPERPLYPMSLAICTRALQGWFLIRTR